MGGQGFVGGDFGEGIGVLLGMSMEEMQWNCLESRRLRWYSICWFILRLGLTQPVLLILY